MMDRRVINLRMDTFQLCLTNSIKSKNWPAKIHLNWKHQQQQQQQLNFREREEGLGGRDWAKPPRIFQNI